VTEKSLDRATVAARLKEMCHEGVAEGMTADRPGGTNYSGLPVCLWRDHLRRRHSARTLYFTDLKHPRLLRLLGG